MANNNGKSSLFIGDLAIFCSEREIEDAFSPYGEIQEIKIMRSEETSRNLSYGFIKYSSAQSAKRAMTELNGVILCGRPLRIRWATYKSKVGSKEPKQDVLETSPVHVSFISYQIDKLVTEESLRDLFSKYGLVVDASIKKSMIDTDVRRQSGYGFVHYSITGEGIHAAIRAASSLDDITVESVNYKCSLSHNLNKYLTGELTMPAEDSQIPGLPPTHNPQHGGGAYQEDLGLVDSDQFFHSPPQTSQQLYNVTLPPPGAGPQLYRPGNGGPANPAAGMYQQPQGQYSNPQQTSLYQQPKYISQVPQAARNRPPPIPPQVSGPSNGRPRSMNGYQDLQNQMQHQHHPQYDMGYEPRMEQQYGARFENSLDSRYKQQSQAPQGQYGRPPVSQQYANQHQQQYSSSDMDHDFQQQLQQNQQLQGVFARGSIAQQRSSNSQPNLISAAVNGAYQQNRTMAALERPQSAAQVQLRSVVGPGVYSVQPGSQQARVVSAPNIIASSAAGPNGATNRWSTGSYNIVPPAPPQPSQAVRVPPGQQVIGKGVPPKQYMPAQNYNNSYPTQQQGYSSYSNDYQPNNYGGDLNTGFAGLTLQQSQQQQQIQLQQQQQQQQQQQSQFVGSVFQMNGSVYANNSSMLHHNVLSANISPPPSPLQAFVASPLIGSTTLFNPFQQGFSPFNTVQGQLSPYVTATSMSPLMSPGTLMPRDVMFEENISNAHNLFTPQQTYYSSPVMAMADGNYAPAMFQGNFSTAAANSNFSSNGQQGFDVRQYANQRKSVQRVDSRGRTDKVAPSPTTVPTTTLPSATVPAVSPQESASDSAATPAAGSPEDSSFFGPGIGTDGSPLEREDDAAGTELDSSEPGAASVVEHSVEATDAPKSMGAPPGIVTAGATTAGASTESPNKALGAARRSMIMKHAKQLMA